MGTLTTINEGKRVYETIRPSLELKFPNQFVTIETGSKEYFIEKTIGKALSKAKSRFPNGDFYTIQIGKDTALHMPR